MDKLVSVTIQTAGSPAPILIAVLLALTIFSNTRCIRGQSGTAVHILHFRGVPGLLVRPVEVSRRAGRFRLDLKQTGLGG